MTSGSMPWSGIQSTSVLAGPGQIAGCGGWSTSFETPEFGLARVGIWKRDVQRGTLDVDLAFTAAVDAGSAAQRVRFELAGEPVRPSRVAEGPRDSVVRVRFEGRRFAQDGSVNMEDVREFVCRI